MELHVSVSSIPTVKGALVDRLTAEPALAGVQITYGHPYPEPPDEETVFWGDAISDDPTAGGEYGSGQRSGPIGTQRREERYVLHGYVLVSKHNSETQRSVTERAYEITAAIEQSVRTWTKTQADWPVIAGATGSGSAGLHWVLVSSVEHAEGTNNQRRLAAVHIELACAARI
jgi:hypothetical protein